MVLPLILGGAALATGAGVSTALAVAGTAASIQGANQSKKAAKAAASQAKKVGELEARQYVSEMFLGRAQAINLGIQRLQEAESARNQNIAAFSAMGRDDRSVDAFLKRNARAAAEDLAGIERMSALEMAKKETEATVAYTYGQNSAAGIRAQGNANYLANLGDIAMSAPLQTAVSGIKKAIGK